MALTKYERGTSWRSKVTYTSGSSYVDCSGNMAYLTVYAPNGDTFIGPVSGTHVQTGIYDYYISTQTDSNLGIYVTEWRGMFNYPKTWNWKYDREANQLVYVKQS
jgi:hypothetical protein